MGTFIILYHIIDGFRSELGYITRAPEGLVFTASYRRALDVNDLWEIQIFMTDHRHEPLALTTTAEIQL